MTPTEQAAYRAELEAIGFDSESIAIIMDDLAAQEDWRDEQADEIAALQGVG